jgi:nitrogen fixation/metabolism regulation signal transduction histidine kinase
MAKQVAHEIKNPLTPMRLSLQHLQHSISRGDDHIEEKVKKTIALMIRQIDSLSAMAEEFSSFAKMPEPILENIDLKLVLTDAVDLMEKEMGQPITLKIDVDTIPVLADPHQLGRIFNNIFKNAIQAIPDDRIGQIVVDVMMLQKSVLLTISDNGKGIPPELFDKIFSPNFSTKNSGMGLGLAITKKIIEQFNGRIQFKSEINVGTVFEIEIPLNLG